MVPEIFECDKAFAKGVRKILESDLPETQVALTEHCIYPGEDGEYIVFSLQRAKERVDVVLVLGDPESPDGPYDGKCWIMIVRTNGLLRWWRGRRLSEDVCQVFLRRGVSRAEPPENPSELQKRPEHI